MHTKKFSFNNSIDAVHVDPRFVAEGLGYAERKSCSHLRITAYDDVQGYWRGKTCRLDLTPLSGNESIQKLSIDDDFKISNANIDALCSLKNLRELTLSNKKIKPDFSRLPRLEGLSMDYYGAPIGISSLKELKWLHTIVESAGLHASRGIGLLEGTLPCSWPGRNTVRRRKDEKPGQGEHQLFPQVEGYLRLGNAAAPDVSPRREMRKRNRLLFPIRQ